MQAVGNNPRFAESVGINVDKMRIIGTVFSTVLGAVGILVALLNQILKHSGKEEHAYLLNLAGLIIVLSWVIPYISDLFNEIMDIVNIGQ